MALAQIDFEEAEEEKISTYSNKWSLNKPKTVRRIVREFDEPCFSEKI